MIVATFALTACDSSNALLEADTDVSGDQITAIAGLSDQLNLTGTQSQAINDIVAKQGERTPGTLWYVAAELQSTLNDEQKATLLEGLEDIDGEGFFRQRVRRGAANRVKGLSGRGGNLESIVSDLTDEQKEAVKALHEKHRETIKGLVEQRRDGTIDADALKEAMQGVREELKTELSGILSEEQMAKLEAARQEKMSELGEDGERRRGRGFRGQRGEAFEDAREAINAARKEALGLSDEQASQLKTVVEAQREKAKALFEEIRENADDRESAREALREQMSTLRDEAREASAAILTDEQEEIIQIHRVLSVEAMKKAREARGEEGKGRRGNRRFNRFNG